LRWPARLQRLAQAQVHKQLLQLRPQRGVREAGDLHRLAGVHPPQHLPHRGK